MTWGMCRFVFVSRGCHAHVSKRAKNVTHHHFFKSILSFSTRSIDGVQPLETDEFMIVEAAVAVTVTVVCGARSTSGPLSTGISAKWCRHYPFGVRRGGSGCRLRDVCVWFSLIFCPEKQPNGARSTATCDIPFVGIADHHIQTYNGIWVRVRVNEMNGSSLGFVLYLFLSFSFITLCDTHTYPRYLSFLDSISIYFFLPQGRSKIK